MSFYSEESNIFYMYFQIIKSYKKYMFESVEHKDLTPGEIDVLTFLINNKTKDITAKDIALRRGVTKGLISKAVSSLLDKDLIEKKENKSDARSFYLKIKNEDNELIMLIKKSNDRFIEKLLKDIDIDKLNCFININKKMLNNLSNLD